MRLRAVVLSLELGDRYLHRTRCQAAAGSPRSKSTRPPHPCPGTAACRAPRLGSEQIRANVSQEPNAHQIPSGFPVLFGLGQSKRTQGGQHTKAGSPSCSPASLASYLSPLTGDPQDPALGNPRAAASGLSPGPTSWRHAGPSPPVVVRLGGTRWRSQRYCWLRAQHRHGGAVP